MTSSDDNNNVSGVHAGGEASSGSKAGDRGSDRRGGDKVGDKVSSDASSSAREGAMSAEEALITQVAREAEAEKAKAAAGTDGGANGGDEASTEGNGGGERDGELGLEGLEAQVLDLEDRLSRALAEVENSRRRFERDRADALRYGASKLATDIFEVADNLRRACGFVSAEARAGDVNLRNLVIGIEMTEKILEDSFVRHGIVVIDPGVGSEFSAEEHQAVSEVESRDIEEGCIFIGRNARRASLRRSEFCVWGVWGDEVPPQKPAASERDSAFHTQVFSHKTRAQCAR